MDVETYALLAVAALFAGAQNSIAGGGTLLTFPALKSIISDAAANATSTLALLPGSLAGAWGYRREVAASRKFVLLMLAPSLLGGFLGAWFVTRDKALFARLVPWLILSAAVLFLIQQPISKWLKTHKTDREPSAVGKTLLIFAQFLIALYGGYFGAGIGILMLTALGFMGVGDIHRMNGVKTVLAAVINTASVVVFIVADATQSEPLIYWHYSGVMAVAAILGGYLGARWARKLPTYVVRAMVIAIGFGLAAYYFATK
jgi:uncharacterized membrane protein YfcA